jgi:putative tryptophan/tyrosine transport system substrate-binding protein
MRRREFIRFVCGVAVWPLTARAQQRTMPLVGVLNPRTADPADPALAAFRRELQALGYVEGSSIRIELRSPEGDYPRLPALAAEPVALKPDVIVTNSEPGIRAAKNAAGMIPTVVSVVDDLVATGFAQSLAHPGGSITGLTNLSVELVSKRLEMIHEIVPDAGRIAVLRDAESWHVDSLGWREITTAAERIGAVLRPVAARNPGELDAAFAEIKRQRCLALVVMSSPLFVGMRAELAALAARHRIPASYDNRLIVEAGGLLSYGPDTVDMYRRAAAFVDKILKGAKPGDIPIEQPTKFELAINLKAARALGLTIPPSLLVGANEAIE